GHRFSRPRLVTHFTDGFGAGTDELDAVISAYLREVGVFRQKSVSWVDGVGAGYDGGADQRRYVQVAGRRYRRTDAKGLIGKLDVQGVGVGLRVDGDGPNAQLPAGPDHSEGDFSSICNENLFKHL